MSDSRSGVTVSRSVITSKYPSLRESFEIMIADPVSNSNYTGRTLRSTPVVRRRDKARRVRGNDLILGLLPFQFAVYPQRLATGLPTVRFCNTYEVERTIYNVTQIRLST